MLCVLVITISIFLFLLFVKNLHNTKENFKSSFRENFTNNTSIKNVHVDTEIEEETNEGESNEVESNEESGEQETEDTGSEPKCDGV